MSFSFSKSGTPNEVIAGVGQAAASTPNFPQGFADVINGQLSGLPTDATVTLTANGHTGWGDAQTSGQISLHAVLDVTTAKAAQPASPLPEA